MMAPAVRPRQRAASADPELPLGEVLDFMRLLWAVDHALQKASRRHQATTGFSGPQLLVIRIVGKFPGISLGQLARVLHLHPSSLTRIVERLETHNLVRRRPDPRDRRRSFLGLTTRGRRLETSAPDTAVAALDEALAELSEQRLQHAREVLATIAETLERTR
jgi:DNA-binding MarR family transcriptional regulator